MADHILIVESGADRDWASATGTAVTAGEYVSLPVKYANRTAKVINLSDDFGYMDLGYYCSLLAEARGQKVIPTVETILDLSRKSLYGVALPELDEVLHQVMGKLGQPPKAGFTLTIYLGRTQDQRFRDFARQVFDRFRSPLLRVQISAENGWHIRQMTPITPAALSPEQFEFFLQALEAYTRSGWRAPRVKVPPRYSLAILNNPREHMPPSNKEAIRKFVAIGATLGLGVEPIERKDYLKLGEYDALFIRETTSLENHTYRFAKKAEHEGLVVIDDPTSILRCTNKVYLAELLQINRVPMPKTVIVDRDSIPQVEDALPFPIVLKIPDGSFSRGVVKAANRAELHEHARKLLQKSDVILAQQYMYTDFDWRVGVLNRQPIYVSQYFMSRKHWQVVNHQEGGRMVEGSFKTLAVEEAPKPVLEVALRAAGLIGDGLYGVDLKQTSDGVFVIEINDNPNLDRGIEDAVLKDDLYRIVLKDFIRRIEAR
ncbi:MAG: RimK family protein [Proteobacteria bacterium]|nr:RimK family protein [Pseudomonadota bacterium]